MIDLRKTLTLVSNLLKQNGIPHALIGGFALAVHGVNRATIDIDFLADGTRRHEIQKLMIENGFNLNFSSEEVLQFTGVGFVDILLANRPLSQQMLQNAKLEKNLSVYVLNVEDLIGLKIQAYSNDPSRELQDKADIQSLILKHPGLNWSTVQKYADLFNQWPTIEKLRKPT
jgi:Nucleotidyltransferase of unknown function (DUF6036)